ncbi:MAG: hypothetical protein OEY14_00830 [Myxococcales bacterium]|nr:hypothetical protein [Myxococcales bacterium]
MLRLVDRPLGASIALAALSWTASMAAPSGIQAQDVDRSGAWTASPLRIRNTAQSWGSDCGPPLPATQSEPGGPVQIRVAGDHLRFSGAVTGSTESCWSPNPALRRLAASRQGERWTVRCATPSSHSHPESASYTIRADGSDRLIFQEQTRWNWALRESRCEANRTASRTFSRQGAAAPDPVIEATPRCDPGPAATLRLSPSRAELEPGDEQCFRIALLDAQGCPLTGPRPRLTLESAGPSARLDGRCVRIAPEAGPGRLRLEAEGSELRASAEIEIRAPDLSSWIAAGPEPVDAPSPQQASGSGSGSSASTGIIARPLEDGSGGIPWPWAIALLVIVSASLALAARALLRSRRGARPSPEAEAAAEAGPGGQTRAPLAPEPLPSPPASAPPIQAAPVSAEPRICPRCRQGYPPDARVCLKDGAELLAYAEYVAEQKASDVRDEGAKVCPECGASYPASKGFCSRDGSALLPSPR